MGKFQIKNKRRFITFCSIVIIALVIIIVIVYVNNLWFFKDSQVSKIYSNSGEKVKSNDISKINTYTPQVNVEETIKDDYFKNIEDLLLVSNVDSLYEKMDEEFLKANGLNQANFKEYLEKNEYIGNFPSVTSMTYCIQRDGSCVYRLKCFSDSRKQFFVNLIERKPYDYTIDFSQEEIPTVDIKQYKLENENLIFEISELKRTASNISYKVKVTNKTEKEIEFFLNNLNDVNLDLEDNGTVQQATSELSSRKYIINKNSYFIKKFYFPLDMRYHSSVVGMTFFNVRVEDVIENITVEF